MDRVMGLMAEDAVFLTAGNPPMRGRKAFKSAFRAGPQNQSIETHIETEEIVVEGRMAYALNRLEVTKDPASPGEARLAGFVLSVFRKEADGRWVLARDANLLTPAA